MVVLFFCIGNKCHLLVFNKEWWKNLFLNFLMKTITSMEGNYWVNFRSLFALIGIVLNDTAWIFFLESGAFCSVQSLIS